MEALGVHVVDFASLVVLLNQLLTQLQVVAQVVETLLHFISQSI